MLDSRKIATHKSTQQDVQGARDLRNSASFIERKLWRLLSVQSMANGLRFRRQHPIHPYVVDFSCSAARLIVEIDGSSHDATQNYDKTREDFLKSVGYHVSRLTNEDVCKNSAGVVDVIIERAKTRLMLSQ